MCNTLSTDGKEHDNDAFIREIGYDEFNQIKHGDRFNDQSFVQDFTSSGINNIKIIAYTDFKLSTAIKNGLNWYLYNEIKTLNGEYIDLDSFTEEDVLQLTQSTYKINICIIESNQEEAIALLKHSAITLSTTTEELANTVKDVAKQTSEEVDKIVTNLHDRALPFTIDFNTKSNEAIPLATNAYTTTVNTTILSSYTPALDQIGLALDKIKEALELSIGFFFISPKLKKEVEKLLENTNKKIAKKNKLLRIIAAYTHLDNPPKLYFSEYNNLYDETLYLFKNGDNYYTILYTNPAPNPNTDPNQVCLLNKNNIFFQNVLIKDKKQRGGTKREQIESIMNQSLLNNLLQNPNAENDKRKILMNTLAYIVPIKLELYEGKDVPTNQKVSLKCEENYNNILKAWKVLFNIKEEKTSQAKPTPSF
jgi:hypothetical protein